MDKLELYKFAENSVDEWHWAPDPSGKGEDRLHVFVSPAADRRELLDILGSGFFDDEFNISHTAISSDGGIILTDFQDWCEDNGFDAAEVFDKDREYFR